jgi:hypothetical protein
MAERSMRHAMQSYVLLSNGHLSPRAPCCPLKPPGLLNASTLNSNTIQPSLTAGVLHTPPQAGGSSAPPCECCLAAGCVRCSAHMKTALEPCGKWHVVQLCQARRSRGAVGY